MLLPFQWAVLTVEEAKLLIAYIETSTATKTIKRNYDKIKKAGMMEIYDKLRTFIIDSDNYEYNLRHFNPYE